MDATFELLQAPALTELVPFRFAHARVRGPYAPWTRVSTLDHVAEVLETHGVDRTGPAFGIYHDLPYSARDADDWVADLGWPVAPDATLPALPSLRRRDLPNVQLAGLSYRGDLTSFPSALQLLVEWSARRGLDLKGPLLERFHVSNPLTGEESRDVYVALQSLSP